MFCYGEKCNGNCDECESIMNLDKLKFKFHVFTTVEKIELGKDLLCLVTSWEEPPYFIVMQRKVKGIVNAFDGSILENTRILKWAYLPECIE